MKLTSSNIDKLREALPDKDVALVKAIMQDIAEYNADVFPIDLELHFQDYHDEYSSERTDPCPDFYNTFSINWAGSYDTIASGMDVNALDETMCAICQAFEQASITMNARKPSIQPPIKFSSEDAKKIFFTSDTHFRHENIIKYCARPFSSVEEHDEELIRRWNEAVPEDGIVFHLGDVAFGNNKQVNEILERLNGTIYLVVGNHDWRSVVKQNAKRFAMVTQQLKIDIEGKDITLNHYPMLCFAGVYRGLKASWQLFGHVHSGPNSSVGLDHMRLQHLFPTQYDVGVDNNDFAPVSYEKVKRIINNQMMSLGMCRNKE